MKKKADGGLANIDTLDFRDADGKQFYEPTTEFSLIKNLHNGWFSVVQVATNEHDNYRWQIPDRLQKSITVLVSGKIYSDLSVNDYF